MVAVTITTMIINKILMTNSSKFDHAELIGNHYFGIDREIKKVFQDLPPPPQMENTQSIFFSWLCIKKKEKNHHHELASKNHLIQIKISDLIINQ